VAPWLSIHDRLRRSVEQFRRGGRDALGWTLRLTSAAVASYVVAQLLLSTQRPLLAPLTALLVVQATPVSLLTAGRDRVASVVAGVLLAVSFSLLVPLTWWSLAVLIALSILIGQAMRLRSNLLEVPISAMLVMGVGAAATDTAAWARVAETLVGAGVGILANLVLPPRVAVVSAAESVDELAAKLSALLRRAAEEVRDAEDDSELVSSAADGWLSEARRFSAEIPQMTTALEQVEEGRRLNVRMVRSPDATPGIRQGLEVLEHTLVALRSMFRGVRDALLDETWPRDDSGRHALVDLAEVMDALASSLYAFGQLVGSEARSADLQAPERAKAVQHALDDMHAARALLFERAADQHAALAELYVSLGSTVKRFRRELDLEDRARRQDMLRPVRRSVRDVVNPRARPPRSES
jgi:hypothetical protein